MQTIEERGQAIYNERLKALLEAEHLGDAVAIHLDTGDYVVNRTWSRAVRELWKKHPEGEIFAQFIGPPTSDEIALATMMRRGEIEIVAKFKDGQPRATLNLPEPVREIIEFIRDGNLLQPASVIPADFVTPVADFDTAYRFGWEERFWITMPITRAESSGTNQYLTWDELNQAQLAVVYGKLEDGLWEIYRSIVDSRRHFPQKLVGEVKQRLRPEYEDIIEPICSDLEACIGSRLALGRDFAFYEDVFQVYRLGGWPCGWDFEHHRLFAYFPKIKTES